METAIMASPTDSPIRKRSINDDSPTFAAFPLSKKVEYTPTSIPIIAATPPRTPRRSQDLTLSHRRRASLEKFGRRSYRTSNMQSHLPPTLVAGHLPSLSSVLSEQQHDSSSPPAPTSESKNAASFLHPTIQSSDFSSDSCFSPIEPTSFNPFHQPRHSTSTSNSESTDSSPTTTASLDSSSMTEPSPGPSPQSPTSLTFAMNESRFTPIDKPKPSLEPTLPIFELHKPAAPITKASKRPRNLKNLAVNTSASYNLGRAIATAPLKPQTESERTSAPASPAFVKPPTPPKRKMGNISLTIMTPANSSVGNGVPPTPSLQRPQRLRHFQSSPSLPLLTSGAAPSGGMTLPPLREPAKSRGFAEIPMEDEEEEDINFDVPQSREEKPESYPNGPIKIYESGVDLYYEPNVEVASQYDVIFNVASEVKNPFQVADEAARASGLFRDVTSTVGILSTPCKDDSPTTPKATPLNTEAPADAFINNIQKRPEYIHIPWEHNTDLVPDLHRLVKVIDDRVQQGKRVLVHCQCGVSRSATLIVAYGLYKNQELSVQEAYDAVKKRSKWIGPNMSLIMQLQEFRSGLFRNAKREHGFQNQIFTLPRKSSNATASATTIGSFETKSPSEPPTPRTAPLAPEHTRSPKRLTSADLGPFSARNLSPGQDDFWEPNFRRSWGSTQAGTDVPLPGMSVVTDTPYVDPTGHVVPMLTVMKHSPVEEKEPRPQEVKKEKPAFKAPAFGKPLPFRRDYGSEDGDIQMTDASPVPTATQDLMSPRATEFHMTPLHPPTQVESEDSYNILSPTQATFNIPPVPSFPSFPQDHSISSVLSSSPPAPTRAAPPPPPPAPKPEIQMGSMDSIFSPTTSSFPLLPAIPSMQPLALDDALEPPHPRQTERIDSLNPESTPATLADPPKPNRRLRAKFSAPNLSECAKLQRMQSDIAHKLPRRPAEAEEVLMSPRATNFVANPFRVIEEEARTPKPQVHLDHNMGVEPEQHNSASSSTVDPRSPAQFGISPITRNIFEVI